MSYSLNEAAAQARKAARGAGYSWAMADEAGAATRWLCARGLDGCAALAGLLDALDGQDMATHMPVMTGGTWHAATGPLCPIHAGAALSDRVAAWQIEGGAIRLVAVQAPAFFLPFAALAARRIGGCVHVAGALGPVLVAPDALDPVTEWPVTAMDLTVSLAPDAILAQTAVTRAHPDPAAWEALERLAHRTYAPATEASRRKGAGSDLPDTD